MWQNSWPALVLMLCPGSSWDRLAWCRGWAATAGVVLLLPDAAPQCRVRVLGPLPTVLASASRGDGSSGASAGADAEPGADADADAGAGTGAARNHVRIGGAVFRRHRACLSCSRAAAPLPFLVFFAAFGACVGYIDFILALIVGTGDGAQGRLPLMLRADD